MKAKSEKTERRKLMGTIGAAALGSVALACAGSSPHAKAQNSIFTPKKHEQDAWLDDMSGIHRVIIDSDSVSGGTNALRYAFNIKTQHINAYGGTQEEIAMIVTFRHASTTLGYNDSIWAKYGKQLLSLSMLPPQEDAPKANPQMAMINNMAENMGVHFAVCNAATTRVANELAKELGVDAKTLHAELIANLVANAHMVPAGVIAVVRAQEYGYSLLYSNG
jgi:intracellular sulfur oxidation DsrE/DsrF family protein